MSDALDLAAHLRYYEDLGVDGLSRDPAWRARQSDHVRAADAAPAPVAAAELSPGPPSPAKAGDAAARASSSLLDRAGRLRVIRDDIGECTRCKLHTGRTNLVFGVGDPEARLMFVGEGPGADEDEQGEPFVGRAGQLLTQIVTAMGFAREQVYIANVVKCRPPGNRNPEPDEIEQCGPFLQAQIDAIKPVVLVALGKFAAQTLLRTETPISRLRGQFHHIAGTDVMSTFHPSYLLRNPAAKREVWEDMKMVMKRLAESQ